MRIIHSGNIKVSQRRRNHQQGRLLATRKHVGCVHFKLKLMRQWILKVLPQPSITFHNLPFACRRNELPRPKTLVLLQFLVRARRSWRGRCRRCRPPAAPPTSRTRSPSWWWRWCGRRPRSSGRRAARPRTGASPWRRAALWPRPLILLDLGGTEQKL